MQTLEGYLAGDYRLDQADIQAIDATLGEVVTTFSGSFTNAQWPYEISANQPLPVMSGQPSHGTSAMILSAVGKVLGLCEVHHGPFIPGALVKSTELREQWRSAAAALLFSLRKRRGTWSRSFRDNDPVTISHVSDLLASLSRLRQQRYRTAAPAAVPDAFARIQNLAIINPADSSLFTSTLGTTKFASSGFVMLRIVRSQIDLLGQRPALFYRTFFESRLHDQLSFSGIPDSRFDPAELAFCLEGLLLCAPEAAGPPLVEQVFCVLADKQNTSAHWRPVMPFLSQISGQIMLPLSVEGANSLVRAISILDHGKLHDVVAPAAIPMMRRFWRWLRARKVQFVNQGVTFTGWHSEHINQPDLIHLWDTSQVVEFLVGYRDLLQRHIARTTLVASGALIREAAPTPKSWQKLAGKFEPVKGNPHLPKVYTSIETDFIRGWKDGSPENYSMLLYGPPGTGKSTVAESVADALGFRLVTLTVSDFLGTGGAMVEARARAIFDMLGTQSRCVVLFDEIDAFLLDRDSAHYRDQDTLFQFLTPGMLTKFNELRKLQQIIFIVATNYENRIDPAIKRPGRIDRRYLLLPPDGTKRAEIITGLLTGRRAPLGLLQRLALAEASLYLGYKDLEGAVARAGGKECRPAKLYRELRRAPRSTSPRHYFERLTTEARFPTEELDALAILAAEARRLKALNADVRALTREQKSALARAYAS